MSNKDTSEHLLLVPGFLIVLAGMAFLRIWLVQDVIWDDNTSLLALYETNSLQDFLNVGFMELRRPQVGTYLYGIFWFHRYTEYFYIVWHSINTLTALLSPLLLFLFLKRAFPNRQELAFFSALAFVVFHLDLSLGFATTSNYRVGLLLALTSFLCTERSVRETGISVRWLAAGLISAVVSHSLLIEATVVLEPARGFLLLHLLRSRQPGEKRPWQRASYLWLPFIGCALPIVIYKLLYKPYGMFSNMYVLNPLFFLEWRTILVSLVNYLLFYWFVLLQQIGTIQPASWLLGILGAITAHFILFKYQGVSILADLRSKTVSNPPSIPWREKWKPDKAYLLFCFLTFIPAVLFFLYIGRTVSWNYDSSHAVISQFGYAMVVGWLLALAYRASIAREGRDPWMKYLFSVFMGAGIFFANAAIDQYLTAWETQNRFWAAFTHRFPRLPENHFFIFDIQKTSLYADPDTIYSIELQMDLLYADSSNPTPFRRVRGEFLSDWYRSINPLLCHASDTSLPKTDFTINLRTYFGDEAIKIPPSNLVFVSYRNGELLINHEITERYPDIACRYWMNHPAPDIPPGEATYPLRYKMRGLNG